MKEDELKVEKEKIRPQDPMNHRKDSKTDTIPPGDLANFLPALLSLVPVISFSCLHLMEIVLKFISKIMS